MIWLLIIVIIIIVIVTESKRANNVSTLDEAVIEKGMIFLSDVDHIQFPATCKLYTENDKHGCVYASLIINNSNCYSILNEYKNCSDKAIYEAVKKPFSYKKSSEVYDDLDSWANECLRKELFGAYKPQHSTFSLYLYDYIIPDDIDHKKVTINNPFPDTIKDALTGQKYMKAFQRKCQERFPNWKLIFSDNDSAVFLIH